MLPICPDMLRYHIAFKFDVRLTDLSKRTWAKSRIIYVKPDINMIFDATRKATISATELSNQSKMKRI